MTKNNVQSPTGLLEIVGQFLIAIQYLKCQSSKFPHLL